MSTTPPKEVRVFEEPKRYIVKPWNCNCEERNSGFQMVAGLYHQYGVTLYLMAAMQLNPDGSRAGDIDLIGGLYCPKNVLISELIAETESGSLVAIVGKLLSRKRTMQDTPLIDKVIQNFERGGWAVSYDEMAKSFTSKRY